MLKPKKAFVQAQLNIERLSPLQWDGIMRAMDAYAEHYHEVTRQKSETTQVCPKEEIHTLMRMAYIQGQASPQEEHYQKREDWIDETFKAYTCE